MEDEEDAVQTFTSRQADAGRLRKYVKLRVVLLFTYRKILIGI